MRERHLWPLQFVLIFLVCNVQISLFGQTTRTSIAAGTWGTASNWSPSGVPSGDDIIIVNHAMTRNGALELSAWSTGRSITFNTGGSLSINGSLTLQGAGMNLIMNGGSINVTGTLTTQNGGGTVSVNSGTITAGTLQVNYGSTFTVQANGQLDVANLNTGNDASAFFYNYGTTSVSSNVNYSGQIFNFGDFTANNLIAGNSGTSIFTNQGNLQVNNNVTLGGNGKLYAYPSTTSSSTIINGDISLSSNENIVVGTNVAPEPYADMVVKGDIISSGSGDIRLRRNARFAVFGVLDASASSGGSILTLEEGGQLYVHEGISYLGGGDLINNQNTQDGYIGLYIGDGADITFTNNSGSGFAGGTGYYSQSGTNSGFAYLSDMLGENEDFLSWLASLSGSPVVYPLPIVLVEFTLQMHADRVTIHWTTATEINNHIFTIERSDDGVHFEPIALISGAGNSNEQRSYMVEDNNPIEGLNFYRLMQTDYDGAFEIFDVKVVNFVAAKQMSINVFPNPTVDILHLGFRGQVDRIDILDLSGRVLMSEFNSRDASMDVRSLTSGTYLLRATIANEIFSARFHKKG